MRVDGDAEGRARALDDAVVDRLHRHGGAVGRYPERALGRARPPPSIGAEYGAPSLKPLMEEGRQGLRPGELDRRAGLGLVRGNEHHPGFADLLEMPIEAEPGEVLEPERPEGLERQYEPIPVGGGALAIGRERARADHQAESKIEEI